MSFKWPPKDPDSKVKHFVDWSRYLGSETISAVAWFVDDADGVKTSVSAATTVNGLTFDGGTNTNTVAVATFSAGTNNTSYTVTCRITFGNDSNIEERQIRLQVREQ